MFSSCEAPETTSPRVTIFSDWISFAWASFRCRVFSSTFSSSFFCHCSRSASRSFLWVVSRTTTWIAGSPFREMLVPTLSTSMTPPSRRITFISIVGTTVFGVSSSRILPRTMSR